MSELPRAATVAIERDKAILSEDWERAASLSDELADLWGKQGDGYRASARIYRDRASR